jgi:preprotein translocase subunit SecA
MPNSLQGTSVINHEGESTEVIGILPLNITESTILVTDCNNVSIDNGIIENPYAGLSTEERELLDPVKRQLASSNILESVKNGSKLSLPVINIFSYLFEDTNIEATTRVNSARVLSIASQEHSSLMAKLDYHLDDENITIQKIIMNRFILSGYPFQNIQAIEKALYIPALKDFALHVLNRSADCKNKMYLQDETISHLNQLLDDTGERRNLSMRILANRPQDLITNFEALHQILLTGDNETKCWIYKILENVANAGKPIASKILDELSKISGNHYAALKDREAGLRILEQQIANNISEPGWFDYLSNNLQDENQSIASKSLKILKISLERRIKLPDNILDNLVNSSPILLQNRQTKDDINYCLNFIDKLKQQQFNSELTKDGVSTEDINQQPDNLSTENSSQEKDLESFLGEIETLNKNNPTLADSLLTNKLLETKFLEILSAYDRDSNLTPLGKKISQWQRDDITNWSNNLLQNQSKAVDDNFLPEMMAVIKRANLIDTNNDPRLAQMLSILMLLLHQPDKGRLIQVATGEGKSTTSAMLAVVLALRGEKVDIITSSQVLAQRDALERKEFFAMFNLKVDHNTGEEKGKLPRYCYSANVVYGDVANFQADLLRDEYKAYQTRGGRPFNSVIIDEVDSMLIDDNSKLVRLAGHIAGMEYLETLLAAIWSELGRLDNHLIYSAAQQSYYFIQGAFKYENGELTLFNNENGEESVAYPINDASLFCKEHIEYYIRQIIEQKSVFIPEYLQEFAISQIENWAKAAINAKNMTENKDYVIKDKSGYSVIAPVDYYNTGIVQDKTSWQNGLQQFLQLKHALRLTAENFTTCFISNMEYFLRYGCKIYGMTGTLGSHDAQDLLSSIYPVDLAVVPTYKPKQFVELTGILAHNSEEWLAKVGNSIIEETSKNRAVLVICQTISDVYKVKDSLLKSSYPSGKIKLYSRNDNDEYLAVGTSIEAGQVIIATNLAGRGTDVKTAKEVEVAGGLHVCLTFLPDNLRVEEQAFGRTSRQGNHGSGQLIIDQSELETKFGSEVNFIDNIADLKNFRDIIEHNKLEKVKTSGADKIRRNDKLFNDFCKFTNELRNSNDNEFKLAQLEELWGIKLKQISEQCRKLEKTGCNSAIEEYAFKELNNFKAEMRVQYSNGYSIMRNPSYLVREGVNKLGEGNRYQQSIDLFDMAINLDASYSFAGYYNRAYAKISQGYTLSMQSGKFDTSWQASAYSDLMAAKAQIETVIIPGLVSIQVISNHKPDSELSKQIRTKINLLKEQINYIESAAKTIENCKNGCISQVSNQILLPDLFTSDVPDDEIIELNMFGILQLFELDTVEPESSIFDGLLVAALGVAQIFVGALCVVAGNYKWGISFITEGLQDLYKSINAIQSGHFNWNNYWTEKGVTLAITLAMMGCENLAGKLGATKTLTKEGIKIGVKEEAKKLTTQELVKQAIKESAIKTVVNIGIDYAATGLSKAAVNEFKDEIRDTVNNKISNCLLSEHMVRSLSHIMMVDDFHHNAKGQNAINQGVADILTSKRNIIGEIASKLLTSLSHSNYTTVKVVAYAARATNTAHDVSKLQDFVDSFCQSLEGKIRYVESNLPSLVELLYSSSNPVISMDDAADIVKTLERIGAINNNQFCSNAVEIIKQNQLGVGEKYRAKISSFASRMIESSAKDYKLAINHLITQQSALVSKSLIGHYQHQLANPIIQEGMQQVSLSDKISDTLLGDSYRLNDAIRDIQSRNGYKVINLAGSKGVAIAAGDDDGTIMLRGKEKSSNSEPALKLDPHNTNVQPGLTIRQPQKLDKSLFGTGEESAQGTSRQLGTVDSIGNGHHPELVSGYRPITAADIGFAGLTSADIALLLTQPKSPLPVPVSQKTAEYLNSVALQSGLQQPSSTEVNKQSGEFTLDEQASIAAVGRDIGLDYDPRTKIFIKENPWAALALAAAPYVGMGVGLLGRIGFGATARLLPTIAAEGGGGSSIVGGSQLANAGSRLLMTDATAVGANVGARIGSTATTATPINPLYMAVNATTAAAIFNYSLKAIEDTNNLLGQNYSPTNTDRSVLQQSQATTTQPVKVWDVNKPLPTNINPCAIIDLDANKPIILTTPIPSEKPITILSTPDHRDILQKLSTLPGLDSAPSELTGGLVESLPDHSDLADSMNIFYKKIDVDYGKLSGEHFDNDLRYLHDKKYAGVKIGDIDPAIRDRMTDLIIFDASGIIKGIHNTQDHHIIPQSTLGAKELFEDLGLDIHGQENRQTLPADEKLPTKMTQHIGRHDGDTTRTILLEVENISEALENNTLTKEQAKQELLRFIEKEKQLLISGEKSLNSVGRK